MRRKQKRVKKRKNYCRKQRDGFLNRYDFAYADRDSVNQVGKIAPGLIKNDSSEINNIAQQQINQAITQGGKKIERIFQRFFEVLSEKFTKPLLDCSKKLENNNCKK